METTDYVGVETLEPNDYFEWLGVVYRVRPEGIDDQGSLIVIPVYDEFEDNDELTINALEVVALKDYFYDVEA